MASSRPAGGGCVAGDEAIWRKLWEAGFDEEAVRRRDKATLIAYIARLESEIFFFLQLVCGLRSRHRRATTKINLVVSCVGSLCEEKYAINKADVLIEKLGDTSKNLAKRDLLRESNESLILERKKKIGANNIEKMWMVGRISIVGCLFGTAVGTLYAKFDRRKLLEKKEARFQ